MARRSASCLGVVLAAGLVAAFATRSAAETSSAAWIYIPSNQNYQIKTGGSVIAFGDCGPLAARSRSPRLLYVAFSRNAMAEMLRADVIPLVQIRIDGEATGLDVASIVPNEAIKSLWTIGVAEIHRPLVERMAAARKVSLELGGWAHGTIRVFETIVTPDVGRREVLDRVAKKCFH